ncbi:SIMPL domain-containing protein [Marivita sp.]|uniref:SIMPL domain-containing protein n=1 Tax=Marivita sp. TaxID=2003365 RepID=UPI0025C09315|nr:SIMPL domain-containing protein [Marivita sp.]
MSKFSTVLGAIVLSLGLAPAFADTSGRITVTGDGSVSAAPDMAIITMGAAADAESAKIAMDETSAITSAILERLTEAGIASRDIQTSDLSLIPMWSNQSSTDGRRRIEGYRASNRVTANIRDLDVLGPVLDAVLTEGATNLGGLQFTISDPEPLMNDARRKAVEDARARADLFAEASGVTLGRLLSLSETASRAPRPETLRMARAADAGVPVAEGETEISAGVTLVYAIAED